MVWAWQPSWSRDPDAANKLRFSYPLWLHVKCGYDWSNGFWGEDVWRVFPLCKTSDSCGGAVFYPKAIIWIIFVEVYKIMPYGAFCRMGIDNLFKWFRSTEQDGRHTHLWKTLKNLFQKQKSFEAESWYLTLGTQGLPSLFKWWS